MKHLFKYALRNLSGGFITKLESNDTDAELIADRLIRQGIVLDSYDSEIKLLPIGDAGFYVITETGKYLLTKEKQHR